MSGGVVPATAGVVIPAAAVGGAGGGGAGGAAAVVAGGLAGGGVVAAVGPVPLRAGEEIFKKNYLLKKKSIRSRAE